MKMVKMAEIKDKKASPSHAPVYEEIRNGTFPQGVLIGKRSKAWPDYEIEILNAARLAGKSDDDLRALVKAFYLKRQELFGNLIAEAGIRIATV